MKYRDGAIILGEYRNKIRAIREEMRALQAAIEPEHVEDYLLLGPGGPVRLSELFGGRDYLFMIHNMGRNCAYCTLWADGYNGLYDHITDRAAFFVSSPDPPAAQSAFAQSRGWRFPMISHQGSSFAADLGYKTETGYRPGVSVFVLKDGVPWRQSDTACFPWDDFNPLWHLFDMAPGCADGWRPKSCYDATQS